MQGGCQRGLGQSVGWTVRSVRKSDRSVSMGEPLQGGAPRVLVLHL
jgi:hypothetical protein